MRIQCVPGPLFSLKEPRDGARTLPTQSDTDADQSLGEGMATQLDTATDSVQSEKAIDHLPQCHNIIKVMFTHTATLG